MATTTRPAGVQASRSRGGGNTASAKKKNRLILYGGLGLGGFLLLAHKGGGGKSTAGGSSQDQLGAYQAGVNDASNLIGATTGSSGIGGGGGGSADPDPTSPVVTDPGSPGTTDPGNGDGSGQTGGASNPGQIGPINVTVTTPPAPGGPKGKPAGKKPPKRIRPGGRGPGKPPPKNPKKNAPRGAGTSATVKRPNAPKDNDVKPKVAPKGKPAPAAKSGGHPSTPNKTAKGTKKRSPALVESIRGSGSGVVVMGREFPGAVSHRIGAPFRRPNGSIVRVVTVDYGGRTEAHAVHGTGQLWEDNVPGANPPSRGIPQVNTGVTV